MGDGDDGTRPGAGDGPAADRDGPGEPSDASRDGSPGEESPGSALGRESPGTTVSSGPDRPLGGRHVADGDPVPDPRDGIRPAIAWLFSTNHGTVLFFREILVSVLVVLAIGGLLFAVSGVWPPLVAVESGSMEPHLYRGDLVFVMEEHRLAPDFAVEGTGIVTKEIAEDRDYTRFGGTGDVIVYRPFGSNASTPVIHRAHFYVEDGENWYQRADPDFVRADSCEELRYCPAPYAGFITKGDNAVSNDYYDQARGISTPVKPEWVRGRAVVRIPWLGWVRLAVSDMKLPGVSKAFEAAQGPIHSAYFG